MNLEMLAMAVVVGLIAGWLAGFVMKDGGYGLTADMLLSFAGGIVGGWLFRAVGIASDTGWFATVVGAFVGAALVIIAQRKIWDAHA